MKRILLLVLVAGQVRAYGLEELPGWPFEASTFTRAVDTLRGLVFAGFGGGVVIGRVNPVDTTFEAISDRIRAGGLVVDLAYDPETQRLALAVVPDRVEIWDVGDPVLPVRERVLDVGRCFEKGRHPVEGSGGVALGPGWLLVACGERGLLGMELLPFAAPVVVLPGTFRDVDRWGADGVLVAGNSVFLVLDVTDWQNPVMVGSAGVGGARITPGESWVVVAGDWPNTAWGLDLRDPTHPRVACDFHAGLEALEPRAVMGGVWDNDTFWVSGALWIRGYVCEDTGRVVVEIGLPDSAYTEDKMMLPAGQGFVVFEAPQYRSYGIPSLPFALWVPPGRDTVVWLPGYRLPGHAFRVDRVGRWYALADQAGGVRVLKEEGGELVEVPTADVYPVDEVVWVDSTLLLASSAWALQKTWVLQWNGQRFEVVSTLPRPCQWMVAVGDGQHVVCASNVNGNYPVGNYLLINLQNPLQPVPGIVDSLTGMLIGDMKILLLDTTRWVYTAALRFDPFDMTSTWELLPTWTGQDGAFTFGNAWFITGTDFGYYTAVVQKLDEEGIPGQWIGQVTPPPPTYGYILPWDMELVGSLLFLPCGSASFGDWTLCAYDLSGLPDPPLVMEKGIGDYFMDLDAYGDTLLLAGVGLRRFRVTGLSVGEGSGLVRPRLRVATFPGGVRLEGDRPGFRVEVLDVQGRRVRRMVVRGVHRVFLPRGVYVLRVQGPGTARTRKILIP